MKKENAANKQDRTTIRTDTATRERIKKLAQQNGMTQEKFLEWMADQAEAGIPKSVDRKPHSVDRYTTAADQKEPEIYSNPESADINNYDLLIEIKSVREFATGVYGSFAHPTKYKMALFLIIPDNDQSFNYIISMLYTQAFDILMRMADNDFRANGGALPIPIEFWMDEFYAGARPYKPEALMGVVRSRNISMIPILQSVAQLKALFPNDRWQILQDNCAVMLFLGSGPGAKDTHEYISALLGKQTIDTVNDGTSGKSGNTSYNKMGRELMTPSEVRRMERKYCIIFMEGEQPIYDRKALPWEMPEEQVPFQEAMAFNEERGGYVNPVHVIEDARTGELFTVHENKAPVREVKEGEHKTGKTFDIQDLEFMCMNFQKSRGQRE